MKGIQKYRLVVQILFLILTIVSFFRNFKEAMLVVLILTLLYGAFYCGWMCPYGFMQEIFSKIGRLFGIKKRKMPQSIQKILILSRYILFGSIVLIGLDLVFNMMSFDPRVNIMMLLSGKISSIYAIVVMLFFLLISLFFERPFCNYLCYEGAKYGLMSSLRIFTIKRDESICVDCKKCNKACPMNIQVSKCNNLRSPQCINCFQCISSCPVKNTLHYGKANMTKLEKKRYIGIITTACLLITTFVGYNIYNGNNPLGVKHSHRPIKKSEIPVNKVEADASKTETTVTEKTISNVGDESGLKDGVYTGEGEGFKGATTVEVMVKNHKITEVKILDYVDDRKWFNRAYAGISNEIINVQSADVDIVSGATYSSIGIKDAVKDALAKAK